MCSSCECSGKFWAECPRALIENFSLVQTRDMTFTERMNVVTRVVIIVCVLYAILGVGVKGALIMLISLLVIVVVGYYAWGKEERYKTYAGNSSDRKKVGAGNSKKSGKKPNPRRPYPSTVDPRLEVMTSNVGPEPKPPAAGNNYTVIVGNARFVDEEVTGVPVSNPVNVNQSDYDSMGGGPVQNESAYDMYIKKMERLKETEPPIERGGRGPIFKTIF